jgi:hypothetical protein
LIDTDRQHQAAISTWGRSLVLIIQGRINPDYKPEKLITKAGWWFVFGLLFGAEVEDAALIKLYFWKYHDPLSINLSATKLCQELTLMKLDDKWRRSYESFLHFWTVKIQDLEGIEY